MLFWVESRNTMLLLFWLCFSFRDKLINPHFILWKYLSKKKVLWTMLTHGQKFIASFWKDVNKWGTHSTDTFHRCSCSQRNFSTYPMLILSPSTSSCMVMQQSFKMAIYLVHIVTVNGQLKLAMNLGIGTVYTEIRPHLKCWYQ